MSENKTDYTKPRTDLIELLPEPLQSDVNLSLFDNIFNRFLTKQEVEKIAGYIGQGNPNALRSRQIHETDVHRQAYQLQPIPYNKIGSIEHMTSWKDMQNELERLGVDISCFDEWGTTQKFNWVPPVDINKIINYRDYYWVDLENPSSTPQYITIRNTCATATARVNFWESLIAQFGSAMPIVEILPSTSSPATFTITDFPASDELTVEGDVTAEILRNDFIDIITTTSNDGTYFVNEDPVYSGITNETSIKVSTTIVTGSPVPDAKVALRRFDKLVLAANDTLDTGDYTGLLEEGFVFFVRNTSNVDLNDTFVEIVSSTYDEALKQTTATIDYRVTDDTAGGEVSLEEQLSIFESDKKCQCDNFGGWDTLQWDDNPLDLLWGDDENATGDATPDGISDHTNLIDRISHAANPVAGVGTHGELWYATTANVLYQAVGSPVIWDVIWNNFSLIIENTIGIDLWDMALPCDTRPRTDTATQWIKQNHWLHKNDVVNFAAVTRASIPIIEYDWDLELNEWTFISYNWSYRAEVDFDYVASTISPPRIELEALTWWESGGGATITLDDRYGDLTDYFIEGREIHFVDELLKTEYTVVSSSYKKSDAATSGDNAFPYRTFITFDRTIVGASTANLTELRPNVLKIIPTKTTQDDIWLDYGIHWRFDSAEDSLPSPHQSNNPFMDVDVNQVSTPVYGTGSPLVADYELAEGSPPNTLVHEYTTSLYSQNFLLSSDTTEFLLVDDLATVSSVPITSRPLTRIALFGHDDIRVYGADFVGEEIIREIGTYDEIGEVVFDIIGVDFTENEFIIGDPSLINFDPAQYFVSTHTIRVEGNINNAVTTYTVDPAVPSTAINRIKVSETIPTNFIDSGVSGNISNITVPVRPEDGVGFSNVANITVYTVGIVFPSTDPRPAGTNLRIIVGESAINEIGTGNIKVTTTSGVKAISTTGYRIVEQVKTITNQYPLFDIFTVSGEPAYLANSIFGYRTSSDEPINFSVGLRIIYDSTNDIYEFNQFLLEEDNGELFAYRDYANKQNDFWFNKETGELKFWDAITWSDKTAMSEYYRRAIVSSVEPSDPVDLATNELYWYNTETDTLFERFTGTGTWNEVPDVDQLVTDANLQTIWKEGKNNESYVPAQVDWVRRSEVEYNDAQSEFVDNRVIELLTENPSMSEVDATNQATDEWYESQSNHISPTGVWVGDWEIPDPLYYNHLHENKKYLTSRELFTHFTTIINEQEDIPGWSGTKQGQFNIVHINDINYGLGGTIKEFNNGFDTLISSVMVNNVTPPSLFEFAHDQYEILLNALKEIYRENAVDLLSIVSGENILNLSANMADTIIGLYELNDNTAFLYGDSTTFTDNVGANDLGVRNWIATLPYLNLVHRVAPERIVDTAISLDEVVHHDGHRSSYEITEATADVISKTLIASEDPRFAGEFLGVESIQVPANNITDFITSFNTIANREGVYWYYTIPAPSALYRYVVASSSDIEPPISDYENGVLWMDLTTGLEVLRIKVTDSVGVESWDVVDGLTVGDGRLHNGTDPSDLSTATISAWELTDLNVILGDIIFNLENRLYENVDDTLTLNYDFETTTTNNVTKYAQYSNESFLSFVSQSEIEDPFRNDEFDATDPYTWNYKRSAQDGNVIILSADELTNSFVVVGDRTTTFVPNKPFYVKNSKVNDGSWAVISGIGSPTAGSVFDGTNTTIYVTGDVKEGILGSIYSGTLPSPIDAFAPNNLNDGSESGGDWHDLYEKFYGTPYPHLEPWILQGYSSKPTWWDDEYLNDDIARWGDRTWKHSHGFDIIAFDNAVGSPANQSLTIEGEVESRFVSTRQFAVDNTVGSPAPLNYTVETLETIQSVTIGTAGVANFSITDTGFASATYAPGMKISITNTPNAINGIVTQNYTIKSTNLFGTIFTIVVEEEILAGDLIAGTDFINGAIYEISTNTTTIYTTTTIVLGTSPVDGRVAVSYGMWENIRLGLIPAGATYPNGVTSVTGNSATDATVHGLSTEALPKFNYFSVNLDNVTVSSDGGVTNILPDGLLPPYWDYSVMYPTPGILNNMVRSLYYDFSNEIVAPNANYIFGDRGPVEWNWKASSQYLYDQLTIAYRIDPARFIYSVFGFNFTTIGGLLIDRDVRNTASHTRTNFHGDIANNEQFKSDGINQWYVNFNRYTGYDTNFSDFQSLWTLWEAPLAYQFASYIDTPSLSVGHRYIELTDFDYGITSKRAPGIEDFWLDALDIQILNIPYDIIRYNNQLDWRFEIKTNISQTREIEYYDVHNYQFQADSTTNECSIYTWNINSVDAFDNEFTVLGDQEDIFAPERQFTISESTNNNGTYTISYSSYDTVTKLTTITVDSVVPSSIVDGKIKLIYRTIPWETGDPVYLSTTETMPIPLDSDTAIGTTKYFVIKVTSTTFKIANTLADALADIEIPITTNGIGDHYVGELISTFTVPSTGDVIWRKYASDETNILSWSTPKQIQGMQHLVDIVRGYELLTKDSGWLINADNSERDPDTNSIVTWQVELERFIGYAYDTRSRRAVINNRYPVTVDTVTDEFTFIDSNLVYITGDPVVLLSSNGTYPTPLSRGLSYYIIRENLESVKLATSRTDALAGTAIDIQSIAGVGDLSLMTPTHGRYLIPAFEMNPFRNAVWFNQPFGVVSNVITGPSDDIRTTQLIFDQNGDTVHVDQLRVYRRDTETKIVIKDAVNATPELTFVNDDYNLLHLGGLHIFTDSYEHVMMFNNYSAGDNLLYDPFIGLNVTKYEMLFNRNPEFTGRPNVGGYYLETFFNQGANIKENFEAGVENLRNAYDTFDTFESNLMTSHARDSLGYEGVENYLTDLNISEKSQFIFWRGQIQTKGSINAIKAYINSRRFIDAKIDEFWAIKVADFGSSKEKEYPEMFATTVDARSNEFKVEFICSADDCTGVSEGFTAIKMSDTERWYNQPEQLEVLRNNGKIMYFDMKIVDIIDGTPVGSPAISPITALVDGNYIKHNFDVDVISILNTIPVPPVELEEGVNFEYINPNVIKMIGSGSPLDVNNLIISGHIANNDVNNPSRLIDRDAEVQLSTVEFWDPARGHHYSLAIHNVDLQNHDDPAVYAVTPQIITDTRTWASEFVGTSWMDTSTMDYVPYHSDKVITDDSVRFREWGQLHAYASINLYEWVESDVPPSEWDAIAETEEGDTTIPEAERKAGVAKFTLFELVSGEWEPLKNKVDTQFAATSSAGFITYTPSASILDITKPFDVYLNEALVEADAIGVGSPATYIISTAKENDIVKFVQPVPTSNEDIAALLAGSPVTYKQEYEYTTVDKFDSFGSLSTKYYFWVGSKGTKPLDKNRLMSLAEAEQQLVSVPSAYMFYQKPLPAADIADTSNVVSRVEYYVPTGSPPTYETVGSPLTNVLTLGANIASNTSVEVEVISPSTIIAADITYLADGTSNIVTINSPLLVGTDEVRVTYVAAFKTALPNRFSQAIIRGLQGIVFDDSRYTIRFTRDFTLRDNLDVDNVEIGPLDLNNFHEEWKIFRKEQEAKIDKWMWDKITESIIGYLLTDSTVRVPSYEYELYDEKFGTDTQYGLDTNQTFVNGTLGLSSIIAYLIDPTIDFTPVNINVFFNDFNFDTVEDIITTMDYIYNEFTVTSVNRIYFSVLFDAFTTKNKYPGIFKTSMVSLHGIKPFQENGVFDD